MSSFPPYDPEAPLPTGKLALEASAGTGKTYALAELACRMLAEGRAETSELLVVTFTRAATNELRGRVRERVVDVAAGLRAWDPRRSSDDSLVRLLATTVGAGPALARLERAVAEFDAATVTTIHGFARQMLAALGVTSGVDPMFRLLTGTEDLCLRTAADALVSVAVDPGFAAGPPSLPSVTTGLGVVLGRPDLCVVPELDDPELPPALGDLRRVVDRALVLADRFRARSGLVTFDDLLVHFRDRVTDASGAGMVELLRRRFRAVLIDEFQDTDRVQWDIFSTLFDHPDYGGSLVLVGDPKQAIYGFHGADVHTYLRAVGDGTEGRSLTTNWRADGPVLRSLDVLLAGATFGSSSISFLPVTPAPGREGARLTGKDGAPLPALDLRVADGNGIATVRNGDLQADAARAAIHADMVQVVVDLLETGTITDDGGEHPVHPGDLAVLVPSHARANEVQRALRLSGVPAVLARGGSVLDTEAADHLRWLLHAMAHPGDLRAVRMYALSWFAGWTPEDVAAADDASLTSLQEDVRRWSERLSTQSPAEVFTAVFSETGLAGRVLARAGGDRDMTDLDHLVEHLACDLPSGYIGAAGLLAALDRDRRDEEDDTGDDPEDVVARRVESDAAAVQVMTVWTAKGLEFPIVLLPHLWQGWQQQWPLRFVDRDRDRWVVDLAKVKESTHSEAAAREEMGERLRLLYVALTRARHQTVLWWAPSWRSEFTALARILFARRDGQVDPEPDLGRKVPIPAPGSTVGRLEPLVSAAGGVISLTAVDKVEGRSPWWDGFRTATGRPLELAALGRVPERCTRRWSFSAMVDDGGPDLHFDPAQRDGGAGDEQEDEQAPPSVRTAPDAGRGTASPLAQLPAGARFGNLVHAVLEAVNFAAPDLEAQLDLAVGDELAWRGVDLTPTIDTGRGPEGGRALLVAGLAQVIRAPLGGVLDGFALAGAGPGDRLTEVSFDLRLAGAGPPRLLPAVGRILRDGMSEDDPLAPWAERLAVQGTPSTLAGHLTGSIDLVVRVPDGAGGHRFVVCDYKTNALHPRGQHPGPDDYGRANLAAEMARHDYPLQAALYTVALHRYLRGRLPDYDPDTHLGGASYLFVRGMGVADDEGGITSGAGTYDWRIATGTVVALSDALDGVAVTGAVA